MDYRVELGHKMYDRRKAMKKSQEKIAEKLKITPRHYNQLEQGQCGTSLDIALKIHRIMGISLDDIANRHPEIMDVEPRKRVSSK